MDDNLGMNYLDIVANGNAGEFYFAYWISKNFTWPCRILDIDMGLDAQVEIYDESNLSTGMFIGVQVKTTVNTLEVSPSVSVPLKNIVYWESIKHPIVIVRVCFNDSSGEPCIYWKHLQKSELNNYLNKANQKDTESVTINFQIEGKLLLKEDKKAWLDLFLSDEDRKVIDGTEYLRTQLELHGKHFEEGSDGEQIMVGLIHDDFPSVLNELLNRYDELQTAIKINPWIEYLSAEVRLTVKSYNSYISILLKVFEEGYSNMSFLDQDLDGCSQTNLRLLNIMNK